MLIIERADMVNPRMNVFRGPLMIGVPALHRTQQKDVLNLANKLKSKHVQWQNHKMKVSVAAQTLSHSVSAAITFLRNLQVPEFKDSKATSEFILLMNNLFDILNSKSKFGKYTKRPITLENFYEIEGYLMDGIETLKFLKDTARTYSHDIFSPLGVQKTLISAKAFLASKSMWQISRMT